AEGLGNRMSRDFEGFATWGSDDSLDSVPNLLARKFLDELALVDADGPRFGRTSERTNRESASGKILLRQTVRRLRLRSPTPFVCDRNIRDFDIAENRVLASAAWVAAGLVSERGRLEPWQSSLAFKWRKAYHRPDMLASDLAHTAIGLANGAYGGPRGRYVHALTLARLILGQAGLSQEGRTRVMGDALLLNSASLFEDYVRAVLTQACAPLGLTVSKGGSPVQFLYDDGSFGLVPDIRISRGLATLVLGDAKYKDPDAGDHYQMATYMRAYSVPTAFLLCPDYGDDAREPMLRRRTADGRTVVEVRLPLRDLDAAETLLGDLHRTLPFPTT
ncbi:MAG: hypothetical protein J0I36_11200, partial [Pandoraea sp.]|nr:hypothetical protein [Pandoraea sp.]